MDREILVSVCTLTYNHEAYLRDTLEGILMQKVDFPMEILVNDDASTDTVPLTQAQKIPKLFAGIFDTSTVFGRFMDNVFANYASTYLVFAAVLLVWFVHRPVRGGRLLDGP